MQAKISQNFNSTAISEALLEWFSKNRRQLPWRTKRSVYGTLVSEFMLQQTQVKTVLPYYERWMRDFPTIFDAANASEDDILKHWEGLGYYSRARRLHAICQALARRFQEGKEEPKTPEDWLKFDGIGPYTANAIASIAQHFDILVVDGNVIRVMSRLLACPQMFSAKSAAENYFLPFVEKLILRGKCGSLSEAIMELGALVCTPKNPQCASCPCRAYCEVFQQKKNPELYPNFAKKLTIKVEWQRLVWIQDSRILLYRSRGEKLRSLYEFPQWSLLEKIFPEKVSLKKVFEGKRSIGQRRITEIFSVLNDSQISLSSIVNQSSQIFEENGLVWVALKDLEKITFSGPHRRWLEKILSVAESHKN